MEILLTIICCLLPVDTAEFRLQNGDLIFQEACPSNLENSIKAVTTSIDDYQFTHVGIVYIDENEDVFVLEATRPQVKLTPLNEYLYPEKYKDCYPKSVVGRLKAAYQPLIDDALREGMLLIGKAYDYGFVLDNDKYYCSELVYDILKKANDGKDVFPLNTMTFKSKETGEITQGWKDYFDYLNLPVPEGEPGINPGAMSRSEVVDIVYSF